MQRFLRCRVLKDSPGKTMEGCGKEQGCMCGKGAATPRAEWWQKTKVRKMFLARALLTSLVILTATGDEHEGERKLRAGLCGRSEHKGSVREAWDS